MWYRKNSPKNQLNHRHKKLTSTSIARSLTGTLDPAVKPRDDMVKNHKNLGCEADFSVLFMQWIALEINACLNTFHYILV